MLVIFGVSGIAFSIVDPRDFRGAIANLGHDRRVTFPARVPYPADQIFIILYTPG